MKHTPSNEHWPSLDYASWKETYETLHMWTQIVGKLRLCKTPWTNHSWHATLYVTPLGLTTSPIPLGERSVSIDFDFSAHELYFATSDGDEIRYPLQSETVASFYERFDTTLRYLDIEPSFYPSPNEVPGALAFSEDHIHCTYNRAHVMQFWQALVRIDNIFKEFRSDFIGKCSPIHFFWGSFDLAVTRFSGRTAPKHPGGVPNLPDRVTREAYSHEVSSCGFWPGNEMYPHAAFYSYAYPEPKGFNNFKVEPAEAYYNDDLHEFLLPYEVVRRSPSPKKTLLSFLQSTYEAAAELGNWDRDALENGRYLLEAKASSPWAATRPGAQKTTGRTPTPDSARI